VDKLVDKEPLQVGQVQVELQLALQVDSQAQVIRIQAGQVEELVQEMAPEMEQVTAQVMEMVTEMVMDREAIRSRQQVLSSLEQEAQLMSCIPTLR
jgi:hypothetical protein